MTLMDRPSCEKKCQIYLRIYYVVRVEDIYSIILTWDQKLRFHFRNPLPKNKQTKVTAFNNNQIFPPKLWLLNSNFQPATFRVKFFKTKFDFLNRCASHQYFFHPLLRALVSHISAIPSTLTQWKFDRLIFLILFTPQKR